jgi:dipeptidyl aminopeptidase/acylaminoacyl peptidase
MKPITYDSLTDIVYVDDVKVSPDGSRASFVRLSMDAPANEYVRTIWLQDLGKAVLPAQPFTAGHKDSSPRWSADGTRLGFISKRNDGEAQVHVIPLAGGEARSITAHLNGVTDFDWSPDGKRIVFIAPMRVDECAREDDKRNAPPEEQKETWDKKREKELREHDETLRYDPRIVHEFPYRSGTTYLGDRWSHVYVADVPASFADDPKPQAKRLTNGDTSFELPTWTRDSRILIAGMERRPEHTLIEYWHDLVRINVEGEPHEVKPLVSTNYSYFNPRVSPDGKWVAAQRILEELPEFRDVTLVILPVDGGEVIDLTAQLDRTVMDYAWSKDGAWLYFTLMADGSVNLHRVNVTTRQVEQLTSGAQEITSFDVDTQGRVVFASSTMADPSALYLRETDGRIVTLYRPNAKFLAEHEARSVEEIRHTSDRFGIQGWVMTPPGFDPAKKYPLALEIHGGPAAMWSPGSRSMWHEWQTLAHRGYVVYFCNPRGSGGYGFDFTIANRGDWGDGPMNDILRGMQQVIERGYVDTERLVMTGGSYGGYLAAWIVGRDQRFKAAVAQRGVYNLISMRGVTDIPTFNDRETGASPWEDIQKNWNLSPISLAPHVQTPLLLEHSEQDYRVPISQAEELYLALRTFKKTVELIRWPREGHELSRSGEPKHRVERVKRIVEWFDRYAA